MPADALPGLRVIKEAFDPALHDRGDCSCGAVRIANLIQRSARKQQSGDFMRVWIAVEQGAFKVLGFYAIDAHSLLDRSRQDQGLGRFLLVDALSRVAAISQELGVALVVLDMLEDGDDVEILK